MTFDLLRFTTAGAVDDGKSTLIGRLLFDSKQVFEDQLEHVAAASERRGGAGALDLALLTDGLKAEREQGITIDVAYRYFATPARRFIIADCPGHQQYTRNMVTGASTADLAVVLVDAKRGVTEQSKRHAFISALLGIPQMVVAINKMDLVEHSQERFDELAAEFAAFAARLDASTGRRTAAGARITAGANAIGRGPEISYIPISALNGDNVVERSQAMPWYQGPALLELLETVDVAYDHPFDRPARFPVQWVVRPASGPLADYRGYAGQLASGALRRGEEVALLPSGATTRIAAIDTYDGELEEAIAPMSLTLRFEDELDVSRGELVCRPEEAATVSRELQADVCWMTDRPLRPGGRYALKHTSRNASAIVHSIEDVIDVHTLQRTSAAEQLALNDIGRVRLRTSVPLAFDPYTSNRRTGSFILIDEASNETVGAGLIAASGT
ncbi:MAG TPA: GTP-binding protein [Solirubrobacteraceae bacterium]|jgi:bifunctional enzyme CysN/CysC|nr:GTP-binding protein [Solirubrobacteraceae bacterium]